MRHIPLGFTEFAVEVHMKHKSKSKLSFKTPWDGIIYGCARDKRAFKREVNLNSDIKNSISDGLGR